MRRALVPLLVAVAMAVTTCTPLTTRQAPLRPRDPVPVVIWSTRDLPAGLDQAVAAIEGVRWVTRLSVGMVDLASVDGGSKAMPRRAPGAILPVSIAALEPSPDTDDPLSPALRAGEAVVTRTAAALRGISPGATVTLLAGKTRRAFRVGAVVEDVDGRNREIVIPLAAAGGLGLTAPRALITSISPDAVGSALRAMHALTANVRARIRALGSEGTEDQLEGRILSFAEVKSIFGEFTYRPAAGTMITIDPTWVSANIVKVRVPLLGLIACNKRIIPQLTGAMRELQKRGLGGLIRSSSGCYSPRMQVGNTYALSRHAYGIAVDVNAATNPYGEPPAQDHRLIEVMESWGFTWGGRWLVPDGMHFEFLRFVDPASPSSPSSSGVR